jgi:phenylacetic acid degradation operon negative regulatory protein
MLPAGWPRRRAHDLFQQRHAQWHETAQAHFRALERGEEEAA